VSSNRFLVSNERDCSLLKSITMALIATVLFSIVQASLLLFDVPTQHQWHYYRMVIMRIELYKMKEIIIELVLATFSFFHPLLAVVKSVIVLAYNRIKKKYNSYLCH
jgi:hypothetical protein